MIRFVDEHRDQFGVEAICRTLRAAVRGFITSRGCRAAKNRGLQHGGYAMTFSSPRSPGYMLRTTACTARKMHAVLKRSGWDIGRDQTSRLMRGLGLRGVRRSKKVFTTRPDKTADLPKDLVNNRDFTASGPGRLWVADVTYAATWSGFAYVAFVTDVYSRRIVGWNVAATLRADILPRRALDMAAGDADREGS